MSPNLIVNISQIYFERLRQEFAILELKSTTVQSLKHAVKNKLARLMMQICYVLIIKSTTRNYNQEKDRVVIEKTFEALLKFNEKFSHE